MSLLRDTMRYYRIVVFFLFLLCAICSFAIDPCQRLITSNELRNAMVGVHIVDIDTKEVVASHNANKSFVPASLVKVLTATAVMKCYDDTTRWHTVVGYTGEIRDHILHGDIVVKGALDPSLASNLSLQPSTLFIDSLLATLARADIRHVNGRVVVDASLSTIGGWSEWMAEDMGFYYGAPCFGANYKGNEYNLYLRTDSVGTTPVVLGASISTPDIDYRNYMSVSTKDLSEIYVTPYTTDYILMGSVPAHRDKFALRCAMSDAPLFMAYDITDAMRKAGIVVDGEPATDRILCEWGRCVPSIGTILYVHTSDYLSDMVRVMLHKSNNLYAESLLRYVALSEDSVATLSRSLSIERNILSTMGVDTLAMKQTDGCGLSRKNLMTPHMLATLLVEAYNDTELGERFVSKFPQVGKEGSVQAMFSRKPLSGILRLKSGSMSGVLCYAGYYKCGERNYAVVLMSNNHNSTTSAVRAQYERLLRDIFATR